mgnify:CR=1 FL=1
MTLPELGVARLRAKVDTGARSSALHVDEQWRFVQAGQPWVGFRLTLGKTGARTLEACSPIFDEREVVDSGGHRGRRVFVRTLLRIAGQERQVEINLTNRRDMLFPMLLGRTALAGIMRLVEQAHVVQHLGLADALPAGIGAHQCRTTR